MAQCFRVHTAFCWGPMFGSQHPSIGYQPPVIPVLKIYSPLQTPVGATHTHKIKIKTIIAFKSENIQRCLYTCYCNCRFIAGQSSEEMWLSSGLNGSSLATLSSSPKGTLKKRSQKNVRAKTLLGEMWNVFWTRRGHYICELIAALCTCTRWYQSKLQEAWSRCYWDPASGFCAMGS